MYRKVLENACGVKFFSYNGSPYSGVIRAYAARGAAQ